LRCSRWHSCGEARLSAYDGLDEAALAARLGVPRLVLRESTGSTLDDAHLLAAGGAESGTLVLADAQTAGRGRFGRAWQSPAGAGIWLAVLLRPSAAPAPGALAVRAGLACVDALARLSPMLAPRLKWPNDVMVLDRKAAGVLCEARWVGGRLGWIALGVGINVRGPVATEVRDRAIALDQVVRGLTRPAVLAAVVPGLLALDGRPEVLDEVEREAFRRAAWSPEDETIEGLDPDGALLVRRAGGILERRVDAA
jgi:BirA family transcriptional regulator, biotin operon repressor / biotin---[acetyl-CoA-carboxylase] ligase